MTAALQGDERCIYDLYTRLATLTLPWSDIAAITGAGQSFRNINTPEDYQTFANTQL
jgi:molybdopterin-guanine dinucleotide biosynthesis protein A